MWIRILTIEKIVLKKVIPKEEANPLPYPLPYVGAGRCVKASARGILDGFAIDLASRVD